jgi:serine protease Do
MNAAFMPLQGPAMTTHPLLQQLDAEMAALVERARRSLVEISNGQRGHGAGAIWHPDGLVITNAHVVHVHAPQVTLADGRTLPARLLACNPEVDLAALKIDASGLPTVELGESSKLRAGEWVMALGHPWGVPGAVSSGVVIGVGAEWTELPQSRQARGEVSRENKQPRAGEWLVAGLQLRPGHSGGPMIDAYGRLVGINTLMAGPGVGVAVPVHVVKRFLQQSMQRASA